jgi:hypothetical protein
VQHQLIAIVECYESMDCVFGRMLLGNEDRRERLKVATSDQGVGQEGH